MTGFYIHAGSLGDRMAYHCDCCHLTVIFGAGDKPRTWCCGKYVEYEEPKGLSAFLSDGLPRVSAKVPAIVFQQRRQPEDHNGIAEV